MLKNRTDILSAKIKKPIKKVQPKSETKQAYELVTKDLLSSLKKAKAETKINLGELGFFQKKLSRTRNPYGDVYRYYRINFKASSLLKKELDK